MSKVANGKKICVVGLGYIGLPTAAVMASRGAEVVGLEIKADVVATINRGDIHIVEPGLEVVVRDAVSNGRLRASCVAEPADAFLIAVPTPFKDNNRPDLRFVEAAVASIAPVLKAGDVVILESTSPVGATAQMVEWIKQLRPDLSAPGCLSVAYCPERVLPGNVLHELISNDRVIGGLTPKCADAAIDIYRIFVEGACVKTSAATAELCKLTENSFRDVNIAFANELSLICDRLGIDVWELVALANLHPRVNILSPGPGVGGHCIAVDPWFIVDSAPEEARLIRTAREVNDSKPIWVWNKIDQAIAQILSENPCRREGDVVIGCFGLSFKADIDDLRESPALGIVQNVAERFNANTLIVEPNIDALPSSLSATGAILVDASIAFAADVLVLLVDHQQFRILRPPEDKLVIDTRGIWST
jgi:UDP-N-acetyl-D-mannosaminuronic acid dehydrogenase